MMLKCWREEPLRRPKYEDLIEDLEGQISEVSGIVSVILYKIIILIVHLLFYSLICQVNVEIKDILNYFLNMRTYLKVRHSNAEESVLYCIRNKQYIRNP